MSGLDVAAGVLAVASAGLVVAKGLIQIADGIGSAGEEVRLAASDTALFAQMLDNLAEALKLPSSASRATQRTSEDLIEVSERILQPFQNLIDRLTPLLIKYRESQDQLSQIGLRVQWYFRHKSKVTHYQQALGQIKATLSCLLGSMNLQEARINAPQKMFMYQMAVENSRATLTQTMREGHSLLSPPPAYEQPGQRRVSVDSKDRSIEPAPEDESDQPEDSMTALTVGVQQMYSADLQSIENNIDDDATQETAVAVQIDLLSLQRKVMQFAAKSLTSEPEPAQRATQSMLGTKPTTAESSLQTPSLSGTSTTTAETKSETKSEVTEPVKVDTENTTKQGNEVDEPIILVDPYGNKWAFPYEHCKTSTSMLKMINDYISVDASLYPPDVAQKLYLYLDNGALIPYDRWGDVLKPGSNISLRTYGNAFVSTKEITDQLPFNKEKQKALAEEAHTPAAAEDKLDDLFAEEKFNIRLMTELDIAVELPLDKIQGDEELDQFLRTKIYSSKASYGSKNFKNNKFQDYFITTVDGRTLYANSKWQPQGAAKTLDPNAALMLSFKDTHLNSPTRNRWLVDHGLLGNMPWWQKHQLKRSKSPKPGYEPPTP